MDKDLVKTLSQLFDEKLKPFTESLTRIEKKLNSVVEQTADLTEFRTEMKDFKIGAIDKLNVIGSNVEGIKNDLNTVEIVTSKNWNEIAKLKSVK